MESEEEEVTTTTDKFQQLMCHINQDVKYLHTGLVARMQVGRDRIELNLDILD